METTLTFLGTPQRLLDKPAPWNKDQIIRRAGLQSIENCGAQAIETFLHNIDLEFLERVLTAKFKYELQKQDARSVQNEIDSQIAAAAALAVPAGVALEQKQPTRHPVATNFRQTAEDIAKHSYFTKFDSNIEMTFWQDDVTKMLNRRVDVTKYDRTSQKTHGMKRSSSIFKASPLYSWSPTKKYSSRMDDYFSFQCYHQTTTDDSNVKWRFAAADMNDCIAD